MLEITKVPTPTLRAPSKELTLDELKDPKMQQFIDDMIPSMYAAEGVGLAAPQVATNIRICVIAKMGVEADKKCGLPEEDLVLVNPIWEKVEKKKKWFPEGCLSVPGVFGKTFRYKHVRVEALDRHGNKLEFEARNFFAQIVQHECDHLQGTLFVDKEDAVKLDV